MQPHPILIAHNLAVDTAPGASVDSYTGTMTVEFPDGSAHTYDARGWSLCTDKACMDGDCPWCPHELILEAQHQANHDYMIELAEARAALYAAGF